MVERMLSLLYGGDYEDNGVKQECLTCHAAVYILAEKYNIPAAKDAAYHKYTSRLENVGLGSQTYDVDFVNSIASVYHNIPPGDRRLRDNIIHLLCKPGNLEFIDSDALTLLTNYLDDISELAVDISKGYIDLHT